MPDLGHSVGGGNDLKGDPPTTLKIFYIMKRIWLF